MSTPTKKYDWSLSQESGAVYDDKTIFSEDQHRVWAELVRRQMPNIQRWACREYLEGSQILKLPADRIPMLDDINAVITPRTGWRTVRTTVRYSDAVPWYKHYARREFLITDYMRTWDELEFTPEPDMFHDIFGHLPFLTEPRFTTFLDMFAPAFFRADDAQRENIKRLSWFTIEFGLIREGGNIKAFGAGLMSSVAEMERVMTGGTTIEPFSLENVFSKDKAIYAFNETLLVFDSFDALFAELKGYFDSI